MAVTKIVPWRSWLTPALLAALHCCQFFPRDAASRLVATIIQRKQHSKKLTHNAAVVVFVKVQLSDWLLDYSPKDCHRHGNTAFTGSDLDGTIFLPATLVVLVAHYTPTISLGNQLFQESTEFKPNFPPKQNERGVYLSVMNRMNVSIDTCSFASQSVSKDV